MSTEEPADHLSVDDLLEIAAGVLGEVQLHDPGLLASAAARPATTVFGQEAYPTFAEKVAALVQLLARNHALVDGNERLAWSAGRAFCILNGRDLHRTVDDAEAVMLAIAAGELAVPDIAAWLNARLV